MPRVFLSFFQIWDLNSRLEGCRIHVIGDLFFKFFWKARVEDSRWTLGLILRFNLRLVDYSIWSAIFIAPHTEDYSWRLGFYSGKSTAQPQSSQKSTRKNSKMSPEVLESLQYSVMKHTISLTDRVPCLVIVGTDIPKGGILDLKIISWNMSTLWMWFSMPCDSWNKYPKRKHF